MLQVALHIETLLYITTYLKDESAFNNLLKIQKFIMIFELFLSCLYMRIKTISSNLN